MIRFRCCCGKELQAGDDYAGRQAVCPACRLEQTVPDLDAEQVADYRPPERPREEAVFSRIRRPVLRDHGDVAFVGMPPATSGKATTCLILGLASLLFLFFAGIPALIFGLLALRDIGRSRGRLGGRGLAVAGMVTGCTFSLVCGLFYAGMIYAVRQAASFDPLARVRQAAERVQSSNSLKQIALAMHAYHDSHGFLPPASGPVLNQQRRGGKEPFSWRVQLLPFLEQEALYRQFDFDQPWDSPHNRALARRMPRVYATPGDDSSTGLNRYQVLVGPGTMFEKMPGRPDSQGLRFADVTDGLSNTLLVVEAEKAIPWTKPEDLEYTPAAPVPRLSRRFGLYLLALGDGSVRMVSPDVSDAALRAAITRNGAELHPLP